MNIYELRSLFLWCTIFNAALLLLTFVIYVIAGGWIYRMHSRWFPMSRDAFNVAFYAFLGAMKLIVWMFNLVPYLALSIITGW